jgi:hypothetical protein
MVIIGYLRKPFPLAERVLLIIVAIGMVISPIGLSVGGLAPLGVGVLMLLYHLWTSQKPVAGGSPEDVGQH